MCVYSLIALPHTPPRASGQKATVRSVLGLDALAMLKDPTYLVFVIASVLACIPLTFYYSFTNAYLNEVGVVNAAGKMTLGQVSEIVMMLLMPFVFRVATVRWILLVGLLSWAVRYVLLAYGDPGPGIWMFYLAIIMHGVCFDFFFVTGQLYTDQEAPPHLRSTAQGFITAMTYGVGMLVGSLLSGGVLDYFSTNAADGTVTRDWSAFWLTSAGMSFVIMLLVFFFFRTSAKISKAQRRAARDGAMKAGWSERDIAQGCFLLCGLTALVISGAEAISMDQNTAIGFGFFVAIPLALASLCAMLAGIALTVRNRNMMLVALSAMSLLFVAEIATEFGSIAFYRAVPLVYGFGVVAISGVWFLVLRKRMVAER